MVRHVGYEQVESTNDTARELARHHPGEPLLVTASRQTAGRGRLGRRWESPEGGAWMTLVWPDPVADAGVGGATPAGGVEAAPLVVGLALAEVIDGLLGSACPDYDPAELRIKWPNDLLLNERKVAGVLCEREIGPGCEGASLLFVGVGVNVNNDPTEIETCSDGSCGCSSVACSGEGSVASPASLRGRAGRDLDLGGLIAAFGDHIVPRLEMLAARGFSEDLRRGIESRLAWLDGRTPVVISAGNERVEGRIGGLDGQGRLVLATPTGERVCGSGELSLRRAGPLARSA